MFDLDGASCLILVEGISDQVALETLAARRGRDLAAEGVAIVAIGGAQAIGNVLHTIQAAERRNAGWPACATQARSMTSAARLEQAGLGSDLTRERMEELGFYVCDADLEDELIRALGAAAVESVLTRNGDLPSSEPSRSSPMAGRPTEDQLRRFFGSSAGKIKYARLLVDPLDLARVPRPLDGVLAHV